MRPRLSPPQSTTHCASHEEEVSSAEPIGGPSRSANDELRKQLAEARAAMERTTHEMASAAIRMHNEAVLREACEGYFACIFLCRAPLSVLFGRN